MTSYACSVAQNSANTKFALAKQKCGAYRCSMYNRENCCIAISSIVKITKR